MPRILKVIVLATALATTPGLRADLLAAQSFAAIADAARNYLAATGAAPPQAQVEIDAIDNRTRLPACPEPLIVQNATVQGNSARQLLNVRCNAASAAWAIYVPATIHLQQPVAVLAQPVPINASLSVADIRMEMRDTALLSGSYFTSADALIGKNLILQLSPGLPIPQNAVRAPLAVRRGQSVTLVSSGSGIQVAITGQALTDAVLGQALQVKNLSSKRIVQGTATAPGIVTANF